MYQLNKVLVFICCFTFIALGQPNFSFVSNELTWKNSRGDDYSPFDKRGYYAKVNLEINVPPNISGDYFLSFTNDSSTNYRSMKSEQGSDELIYYLSKKTNTNQYLSAWPNISSDENTITMSLDGSNSTINRVPIYIWVDPGQNAKPGMYSETIEVKIFEGIYNSGSMPNEVKKINLKIKVIVSNEAQISIGNDSFSSISDFKVKFESLREGEVISYKVFVKSAGNYNLKIYSENMSMLVNENQKINTIIPYKIFLNESEIQFLNKNVMEVAIEKTSSDELTEHQIKLVLGNPSHAFKGAYSDKISLRAISN